MIHTTHAVDFGQATVSNAAKTLAADFGLDADLLAQADRARISAATDAVRYRYDGSAPTATVGHVLAANGTIEVIGNANIKALQFIRVTNDAVVSVTLESF